MSNFKIKIDTKKLEKELNKQIDKMIKSTEKEMRIKRKKEKNDMNVLSQNAEDMLSVFLEKYKQTNDYSVNGSSDEFPERMRFCIKDTMETLQMCDYISNYNFFIGGEWFVTLTPEALEYFDKKGRRTELLSILVNEEEKLLADIIKIENQNGNITEFLQEKIENDKKDIYRGIIGTLKNNGLINVFWASDTVYDAVITQAGRSYFERKELYNKNTLNNNSTYINATNSTVFTGNITNSNINIDNSISSIQKQIEEKCNDEHEKQELLELLEETNIHIMLDDISPFVLVKNYLRDYESSDGTIVNRLVNTYYFTGFTSKDDIEYFNLTRAEKRDDLRAFFVSMEDAKELLKEYNKDNPKAAYLAVETIKVLDEYENLEIE